jgi:predicted amidohydrolase
MSSTEEFVVIPPPPPAPPVPDCPEPSQEPIEETGSPQEIPLPPPPPMLDGQAPLPPPPPGSAPVIQQYANAVQVKRRFTNKIDWSSVSSVSGTDSGAVFFVDFNQFPKAVVKGSLTVVQEMFAFHLGKALKINVPNHYMVQCTGDDQYLKLQENVIEKASPHVARRAEKELHRPYLIVMEFIQGYDIFALPSAFDLIDQFLNSHESLVQLGNIMALDILLNNWDRLPLIWDNDGNGANIVFTTSGNQVKIFAIDQAITSILNEVEGYEKYMQRVRDLIEDLTSPDWNVENSPLNKVVEYFKVCTGYTILPSGLDSIREGLLSTMVLACQTISENSLNQIKAKLHKSMHSDWENVFSAGLDAIHTEFIIDIAKIMGEKYAQISSTLQGLINARTYQQYGLSPSKPLQSGGHNPHTIKITTMQNSAASANSVDQFLSAETGQKTDLLILHEYWVPCKFNSSETLTNNSFFGPFFEIAKKHSVYILLGSGLEIAPKNVYNTSLFVGPEGLIGMYRKRKPIVSGVSPGSEVGVWDTPIGRISVMICFDIENADVFEENIKLRPDIILNPVMIAGSYESSERTLSKWNIAMDEMAHKFEAIARENECTIIRCDGSFTLGSSQTISPVCTLTASHWEESTFSYCVPKTRPGDVLPRKDACYSPSDVGFGFEQLCVPPPRPRTERRDNTGSRYLVRWLHGHSDNPLNGRLSGQTAVTIGHRKSILVWNLNTFSKVLIHTPKFPVTALEALGASNYFVCGSANQEIHLWHADNVKNESSYVRFPLESNVNDLFCVSNTEFVAAHESGAVSFWDIQKESHTPVWHVNHSAGAKVLVSYDPVSQMTVAASNEGLLSVYNRSGNLISEQAFAKGSRITGLSIISNSQAVVSYGNRLSRFSLGETTSSPITYEFPAEGETAIEITSLAALNNRVKNKSWLLVGSSEGTIRLVVGEFQSELAPVVHHSEIHSKAIMSISTDGSKFLVCSRDASPSLWCYKQNRNFINWIDAFL